MRTSIVLASALALAACNSAPEEAPAEPVDTRSPEEIATDAVTATLSTSFYLNRCKYTVRDAVRDGGDAYESSVECFEEFLDDAEKVAFAKMREENPSIVPIFK